MSIRPWVRVGPPDSRGLRRIVVGSETVGSVWSLTELRRLLTRLGYPENLDLDDPGQVFWSGGGSSTWPDRPWRRRATTVLMTAGMLASTILHMLIGWPDALGALTFAQRVTGAVFVLSAVVLGAATVAAVDHCGRRRSRASGALVLLGTLITLATTGLLLFMWFEETEFTPYLLIFAPLWCWAVWALWLLVRERAWQALPRPRTFAAGVVVTALLSAVSLAYSTMYQPVSAPVHIALKAEFGTPRPDPRHPYVHVPLKLSMKNDGGIPAYVLIDDYSVYGRTAEYGSGSDRVREWRKSLDAAGAGEAERYVDQLQYTPISSGLFYRPGDSLDVGQRFELQRVVQIPRNAEFDEINVLLQVTFMRKDRGRIDARELRQVHRSWDRSSPHYCAVKECGEQLVFHGRVRHNNNLINVTRTPRYVTAVWAPDQSPRYSVSSFHFRGPVARSEERREDTRYGVATTHVDMSVPVVELLGGAGE